MHRSARILLPLFAIAASAFGQSDIKSLVLKHLKTSKDFTLKVANQMPDADYGFKLTPPQMSFAEQMVHLSQEMDNFLSVLSGQKPSREKPAMDKKAVVAFIGKSYDAAIDKVSKLTPDQLSKSYSTGDGMMTGAEMLMFLMDHTTHHRASAEMYLRAKGITPTDYEF